MEAATGTSKILSAKTDSPPEDTSSGTKVYRFGSLSYTSSGLMMLFSWLLWGDFCLYLLEALLPNAIPLKLKGLGASATITSILMTCIPSVAMLFWNPIIATWSDRCRTRMGRRIPFLLGGAPLMALVLIAMGFCDSLGVMAQTMTRGFFSAGTCTIAIITLLVLFFNMGNSFVLYPYWALFNDTVPREVMGRFSMMFRIVSTAAVAAFNFLIFPHVETHHREIFIGMGVFFAVAYSLMCFRVKEGEYPPPRLTDESVSFIQKIRTYMRECFGHRYYWYLNLNAAFAYVAGAMVPFVLLMNKHLGLDLKQIGWIAAWSGIITLPVFFAAGMLIDRWNLLRLFFYGKVIQTIVTAGFTIFLFFDFNVRQVLVLTVVLNLSLLTINAVLLVATPPMNMLLIPRDRYGQFASAISMVVGLLGLVSGVAAGAFIDFMRLVHHGSDFAYRYAPVWMTVFTALSMFCVYKLYRWVGDTHGDDLRTFTPPEIPAIPESKE